MRELLEKVKDLVPVPGFYKGSRVMLLIATVEGQAEGLPEGMEAGIPVAILLSPKDYPDIQGPDGRGLRNSKGEERPQPEQRYPGYL